jgi:conjugal transfer/entry exclusion protein
MSIKSTLNASRDFLMAGMRASARVSTQNPQAEKVLRACLDLVETLVRQPPENITLMDVEKTLAVMHQAATELDDETAATSAFVASIRNAAGRLQTLRGDLSK